MATILLVSLGLLILRRTECNMVFANALGILKSEITYLMRTPYGCRLEDGIYYAVGFPSVNTFDYVLGILKSEITYLMRTPYCINSIVNSICHRQSQASLIGRTRGGIPPVVTGVDLKGARNAKVVCVNAPPQLV